MSGYFEGWYFKHQKDGNTLALIPGRGNGGAFIQIITNDQSRNVPYSLAEYHKGKTVRIGGSSFARDKIALNIRAKDVELTGRLRYHGLTPLKSDIMGPFRFFPMECRHAVLSMRHLITGSLRFNGRDLDFDGGTGYIEADSGRSFPESYTWAQCNSFNENCSIMVSAAKIPFMGFHFMGCICAVWLRGREYRLATYSGAKIVCRSQNRLELVQGNMCLTVDVPGHTGQKLYAPRHGSMSRTIHESAAVKARFCLTAGNRILFDEESDNASFEHVE